MLPVQYRLFIEQVISMPTVEAAAHYIQANARCIDDTFFTVLAQMMQEEQSKDNLGNWGSSFEDYMAEGLVRAQLGQLSAPSRRLQALYMLAQYASALRQQMSSQVQATPLPFGGRGHPERNEPMDDTTKALVFMEIDQRFMAAMPRIMPDQPREVLRTVIKEFEQIYQDYDRLLKAGPPQYPLYELDNVRGRMADVLEKTARAYDSLRDSQQAVAYFERAIRAFEAVGQQENAERCRANIAEIRLTDDANVDQEIARLQGLLETLPEGSLKHTDTLISLGELHTKEGDDYEAEQLLTKALSELHGMGYDDPSDQDSVGVLMQTMQRIMSGQHDGGPTQIETLVWVRALYQRLYLALAQICRETNPDRASDYSRRLERLARTDMTESDVGQVIDALGENLRQFRQGGGSASSFHDIR